MLLSTVAPYILYTKGLANVESGKASIMASIEPVVGTLVGTLVFGEPISAGVFLGLALHFSLCLHSAVILSPFST